MSEPKVNLLFITRDFSHFITPASHFLALQLAKVTNLTIWYDPGDIHDILRQIPISPDFILVNDLKEDYSPRITGLGSVDIPVGVFMHDLHWRPWERRNFIEENNIQYIFAHYRDLFLEWYPEFANRMRWFPHFAHTIFRDYGQPKTIDWLLMGAVDPFYPLRQQMLRVMHNKPGFVYHPHPGYRNIDPNEHDVFAGQDYALEINRAKMFLTCDTKFHYPIRKYFEVPACKTLLLAPASAELEDLGFLPGVHYVAVEEHDFLEKAEFYLEHEEERLQIADRGYQLVHSRHTSPIRAAELVKMIEQILE